VENKTTRTLAYIGLIVIFILSIVYRASFEAQLGAGTPNYIDNNAANNLTIQKFENFAVLPDYSLDNEKNKKLDVLTYVNKIVNDENMQVIAFTNISEEQYKKIDTGTKVVVLNLSKIECGIVNISDFQLVIQNKKEVCSSYTEFSKKSTTIKDEIINETFQSKQEIVLDENKSAINLKYQTADNKVETDLVKDIIIKENDIVKKTMTEFVANKSRIEANGLGKIDATKLDEIYQILKLKINASTKKAQFEKETFAYISRSENNLLTFKE
jgi:hypothetical protein